MKEYNSYDGNRLFVIPMDPVEKDFLLAVDRRTKADINTQYRLMADYDWFCNTITNCMVESIMRQIQLDMMNGNAGNNFSFNFYNLFYVRITVKRNENAEKEGNINLSFEVGPEALKLISETEEDRNEKAEPHSAYEDFNLENVGAELNEAYALLDKFIRLDLSKKFGIILSDKVPFSTFAVGYTFISNLFRELLHILGSNPDQTLASINLNDNIEFHAMRKGEGIILTMRPGINAKLIIKSDDMTEEEEFIDD